MTLHTLTLWVTVGAGVAAILIATLMLILRSQEKRAESEMLPPLSVNDEATLAWVTGPLAVDFDITPQMITTTFRKPRDGRVPWVMKNVWGMDAHALTQCLYDRALTVA